MNPLPDKVKEEWNPAIWGLQDVKWSDVPGMLKMQNFDQNYMEYLARGLTDTIAMDMMKEMETLERNVKVAMTPFFAMSEHPMMNTFSPVAPRVNLF